MKTLLSFFSSSTGILLGVALVWQLVMLGIGFALDPTGGLLGHTARWDTGWYQHILQYGYSTEGSPAAPAFYPLMPLLVGGIHFLSFGLVSHAAASLLINTVALWAALVFLLHILRHYKLSQRAQYIGIAAFLAFPSAFFMHVFYSEALFIALGFGAYAFALQRKWWLVGVLLALLTATRLPSLLFVALCGLEFLSAYKWNIKKILNKQLLWFLLALIGFVSYALYLLVKRGDPLAMFHAYSATNDWVYQQFNLNVFATLYDTAATIVVSLVSGGFNYEIFINYALPLMSLVLIGWASIYCLLKLNKRHGIPLALFGLLSIIFFTLNSNVVSVHRYALACIVVYIAIALLVHKHAKAIWVVAPMIIGAIAVQVFLYGRFVGSVFAG